MRVRSAEGGVPVAATLLPCGAAPSASARGARRSPPPEARLCAPPRDHKNIIFCDEELVVEWAQGDHLQIDMLRHVLARKGHHMDEYHLIQRRSAPQQASARWIAENRLGMQEERFDRHKHIGAITKGQAQFLRYMVVEGARLRAGLGACKTGTHPGRVCFVADASALPTIGPGGSIVRDRVYAAARQVRAHACPQARLPAHSCAPMLAPKPAHSASRLWARRREPPPPPAPSRHCTPPAPCQVHMSSKLGAGGDHKDPQSWIFGHGVEWCVVLQVRGCGGFAAQTLHVSQAVPPACRRSATAGSCQRGRRSIESIGRTTRFYRADR